MEKQDKSLSSFSQKNYAGESCSCGCGGDGRWTDGIQMWYYGISLVKNSNVVVVEGVVVVEVVVLIVVVDRLP